VCLQFLEVPAAIDPASVDFDERAAVFPQRRSGKK
jgi:hypothetical protein